MPATALTTAAITLLALAVAAISRQGLLPGMVLYLSRFGFASTYRWLWIAAALAGTGIGVHLRPRFGLVN